MKTQYYAASSLDGFIATQDDSLDWLLALGEPDAPTYPAFIEAIGALAMGAATYRWILDHLDAFGASPPRWPYTCPAWIFSSRPLPVIDGADVRFVQGDVRPVHAAMRSAAGERNIWIVGGGELAGQFLDAGLLDEIIVQVISVTLGAGKPFLPRRCTDLRLASMQRIGAEMVELRYQRGRDRGLTPA